MAVLTSTANADFTPAVGDFIAQVTGGSCDLVRKTDSSASAFAYVGRMDSGAAVIISNPIAGAIYQFQNVPASAVVRAVQ